MFVVRCPRCKLHMRYHATKTAPISEKKKHCTYCGHTFKIHPSLIESRIVREENKRSVSPLFENKK